MPTGNLIFTLGGVDAGLFTIDPTTGQVNMDARDFEDPEDANFDNVYELIITATDDDNNSANQDWKVTIQSDIAREALLIPTAFTPNGDGANDIWIIDNLSDDSSVIIFNPDQVVIYQSKGYARPWDGTYKRGLLPAAQAPWRFSGSETES